MIPIRTTWRRIAGGALLFSLSGHCGMTRADVSTMPWATVGTLTATASFKGKTTILKQTAVGPWQLDFTPDGMVAITGSGLNLTGTWTQTRSKFQIRLSEQTIASLLAGIQNDALAQSNLRVNLEPLTTTCTGTENALTMKLRGQMTVKASIRYPDFSESQGKLTLTYRFAGSMANQPL